jgi:peptidylprolyl isomerase
LAALFVVPALALAACGSSDGGSATPSSTSSADPSADATATGGTTTESGITVTGGFGDKPTLTIPDGDAPAALGVETLVEGTGAAVPSGDTIVVNYLGQTWKPKDDGSVNVFDNSYDNGQPTGFTIGAGRVIPGWDKALVGLKAGTRAVLSIPAKEAYGEEASADNELAGQALVFVVDVLGSVSAKAAATGSPGPALPANFPAITSASGQEPKITSVAGVAAPAAGEEPKSALLLTGTGPKIDATKSLAVQLVQTDTATGKQTTSSWTTGGPQLVPAEQVLGTIPILKDATVGSRAVLVTPPTSASGQEQASLIVVVDVVNQF